MKRIHVRRSKNMRARQSKRGSLTELKIRTQYNQGMLLRVVDAIVVAGGNNILRLESNFENGEGAISLLCESASRSTLLESWHSYASRDSGILSYSAYALEGNQSTLIKNAERTADHSAKLVEAVTSLTTELLRVAKKEPQLLFHLDPRAFEELVAELFSFNGFAVELTQRSRDGGKDIIALRLDLGITSRWIVECKRYRDKKVDVRLVRELYGVKAEGNFHNAVLVTTSSFTEPAKDFERSVWGLSLKDYESLTSWLSGYEFEHSGGLYLPRASSEQGSPNKRLHRPASCAARTVKR